jgi:hypothetical protein
MNLKLLYGYYFNFLLHIKIGSISQEKNRWERPLGDLAAQSISGRDGFGIGLEKGWARTLRCHKSGPQGKKKE